MENNKRYFREEEEKQTPQQEKMEMLKKQYKALPLPKVKEIQGQLKRKSQRYKDLGTKVPKDITSLNRTLTYIVKAKEKEAIEKGSVNENIDYGILKDLITNKIGVKPMDNVKQKTFDNAIDVWGIDENKRLFLKTTDDDRIVLFTWNSKEVDSVGGDGDLSKFLDKVKRKVR